MQRPPLYETTSLQRQHVSSLVRSQIHTYHHGWSPHYNDQVATSQLEFLRVLLWEPYSIYVTDLPQVISQSDINMFADDTGLRFSHSNLSTIEQTLLDDNEPYKMLLAESIAQKAC